MWNDAGCFATAQSDRYLIVFIEFLVLDRLQTKACKPIGAVFMIARSAIMPPIMPPDSRDAFPVQKFAVSISADLPREYFTA